MGEVEVEEDDPENADFAFSAALFRTILCNKYCYERGKEKKRVRVRRVLVCKNYKMPRCVCYRVKCSKHWIPAHGKEVRASSTRGDERELFSQRMRGKRMNEGRMSEWEKKSGWRRKRERKRNDGKMGEGKEEHEMHSINN